TLYICRPARHYRVDCPWPLPDSHGVVLCGAGTFQEGSMDLRSVRCDGPDLCIDLFRFSKPKRYPIRSYAFNATLRAGDLCRLHRISPLWSSSLVSPKLPDALVAHACLPGFPVHYWSLDYLIMKDDDE